MSDSNGGGGNSSSSAGAASSTTPSGGGSGGGKAPGASGRGNNSKLLTHQMSSGSLTGVRSTRDRDITNLVPSGTDTTSSPPFFVAQCGLHFKMPNQYMGSMNHKSHCKNKVLFGS